MRERVRVEAGKEPEPSAAIIDSQSVRTTEVDTGVPGQAPTVAAMLVELGMEPRDLRRIILTHQEHDHIGSLAELARLSGAEILAGAHEADTICNCAPITV